MESNIYEDVSEFIPVPPDLKKALDQGGSLYNTDSNFAVSGIIKLPVDRIKIAMSFVHGISVSEEDDAITKAIIVLAKNLGLNTVAEGVKAEQHRTFLNQRMCDEIQGFYYYRPMPPEDIEELLRSCCEDMKHI